MALRFAHRFILQAPDARSSSETQACIFGPGEFEGNVDGDRPPLCVPRPLRTQLAEKGICEGRANIRGERCATETFDYLRDQGRDEPRMKQVIQDVRSGRDPSVAADPGSVCRERRRACRGPRLSIIFRRGTERYVC